MAHFAGWREMSHESSLSRPQKHTTHAPDYSPKHKAAQAAASTGHAEAAAAGYGTVGASQPS